MSFLLRLLRFFRLKFFRPGRDSLRFLPLSCLGFLAPTCLSAGKQSDLTDLERQMESMR
jgi:hypothetical protein